MTESHVYYITQENQGILCTRVSEIGFEVHCTQVCDLTIKLGSDRRCRHTNHTYCSMYAQYMHLRNKIMYLCNI